MRVFHGVVFSEIIIEIRETPAKRSKTLTIAFRVQTSVISFQQSVISDQVSEISYQQSEVSDLFSAVSGQLSEFRCQKSLAANYADYVVFLLLLFTYFFSKTAFLACYGGFGFL
jgi:hypothetical protein